MPATKKIAMLDLGELTELVDGIFAGAREGVLELRDGDTAMVEIISLDALDSAEQIVFPPLAKLRPLPAATGKHRDVADRCGQPRGSSSTALCRRFRWRRWRGSRCTHRRPLSC
jgi:hypothetical protein